MLNKLFGRQNSVTSFESVNLALSGMRYSVEYEILRDGDGAVVTLYGIRYVTGGGRERIPEQTARCPSEKIVSVLNECGIMKWNGFHGKHPKNVRDGEMFTFTAIVNEEEKIYADGSENFPKNYRTLKDQLRVFLESADESESGRDFE